MNSLPEREQRRHDSGAGKAVDWRTTPIAETPGAQDSDPFRWAAKEILLRQHDPSLHETLDPLFDASDKARQHKALLDALDRLSTLKRPERRSIATDSAVIGRHLSPSQDAREALAVLELRLANRQRDASAWSWWNVLQTYIGKLPAGARVRDCSTAVLGMVLRELEGNLVKA
jgi:hypothetical protein